MRPCILFGIAGGAVFSTRHPARASLPDAPPLQGALPHAFKPGRSIRAGHVLGAGGRPFPRSPHPPSRIPASFVREALPAGRSSIS